MDPFIRECTALDLANGFLGSSFSATSILLFDGALFAGIMVLSVAVALPRRVYFRGLPVEAHLAPAPLR